MASLLTNRQLKPILYGHRLPRGRPRDAENVIKRETQIRWVGLVLAGAASVKEAAYANQVDRRTIRNWKVSLLADGMEDTDTLRSIVECKCGKEQRH